MKSVYALGIAIRTPLLYAAAPGGRGRSGSSERRPRCLIAGVTFTNPAEPPRLCVPCLSHGSPSEQLESVRSGEDNPDRATAAVGYPLVTREAGIWWT